ncbi:unnamed protein product [Trichogramma brassicae]|uniref:Microtubule-associated protein futsch n=1 Tax=Trichogramma brassicae TaxID=86971 RepID=A0A6H5IQP5_9HYME|nr:unnamed protein product [Trichogramma brassicae]
MMLYAQFELGDDDKEISWFATRILDEWEKRAIHNLPRGQGFLTYVAFSRCDDDIRYPLRRLRKPVELLIKLYSKRRAPPPLPDDDDDAIYRKVYPATGTYIQCVVGRRAAVAMTSVAVVDPPSGSAAAGAESTSDTPAAPDSSTTMDQAAATTSSVPQPQVATPPQQHPPPSPLSGCYLLVVLPEPHCSQHRDLILNRLAKVLAVRSTRKKLSQAPALLLLHTHARTTAYTTGGVCFLSWDKDSCHVDLEKELQALVAQAPEGEEARNGERLIQYATENLVTEVLIFPQSNTLLQCMRNLLASFTKHRHIVHAGYTFGGNGSWILQDGTFSLADFLDAFSEHEVQRVLRAYENSVTVDIHCAGVGDWSTARLAEEACTRACRVRVNPDDVLTAGCPAIQSFTAYLGQYLVAQTLDQLMEPSDVVGNIRFSHPTLYVFPGGQGDAALFGINGFNMLVDGGFARKACFWDFARHLDRLDAVLLTRINNSNIGGMASVLQKKKEMHVYPQIGHFFCNIVERKNSNSPDGDKDIDPLILNLIDIGQEMAVNLRHINLRPHLCYRDPEPINLYHKVGHGSLDMYVLSPSKDSREVRDFMAKWNASDAKLFAGSHGTRGKSGDSSSSMIFPVQNLVSICALLVWQPASPEETITRILFPGSTPQHKIFEGFGRLKHLEFLKHPVCTAKSLSPSTSLVALKDKAAATSMTMKPKFSLYERETKRLAESRKRELSSKRDATIEETAAKITAAAATRPAAAPISVLRAETKTKKIVENKKIESEAKEGKLAEKESREIIKKDVKKIEKSDKIEAETKKTDAVKADTEKTAVTKESKVQKVESKKREIKEITKSTVKTTKSESIIKASSKPVEKKIKVSGEKKDVMKPSPTTPKKSLNVLSSKVEVTRTVMKAKPKAVSKTTSSVPAKSAKEANNRKVVEQKNIELSTAASSTAATASSAAKSTVKAKTVERKAVGIRGRTISPSKKLPLSPAKSTRSTPSSIKSEKDAVIRKIRGGTTDSSAVSTPSGIDSESAIKVVDKNLTEKSEDMSLDSIESKVLADLKEEREVVEEIEAVLQKAERIEVAKKEERFGAEDEILVETVDKKGEETEDDVTAEMDDAPKKLIRKESQELTEEEEYLIVEKEEIYTEDSMQSGDTEQKHHLDEVESEKAHMKISGESHTAGKELQQHEEKEAAEEKLDEVPEKLLAAAGTHEEIQKSEDSPLQHKEQLEEEMKQIIATATETVQKTEEKDDSPKKESDDAAKEASSSPDKLDSSPKPEGDQKDVLVDKLVESQERISILESGATTTAPSLPEDERTPLDEIKEDIDEKHVLEDVKEKEKPVPQPEKVDQDLPVAASKPEVKELDVKSAVAQGVARDFVKTPDEVADLPVHEEVDPKLYSLQNIEKDKEADQSDKQKDVPISPTVKDHKEKGFFGKMADKFEKGFDKLTKKRRDSEKDIEEKPSSKASSPKDSKPEVQQDVADEMLIFEKMGSAGIRKSVHEDIQLHTDEAKTSAISESATFIDKEIQSANVIKQSEENVYIQSIIDDNKAEDEDRNVIEGVTDVENIESAVKETESEPVKFTIPSSEENDDDEDISDGPVRDFKEAVRDVAGVLVGTAGIEIEMEKPKEVEEIVKTVAEVLKDDFLTEKTLYATEEARKSSVDIDLIPKKVGITEEVTLQEEIEVSSEKESEKIVPITYEKAEMVQEEICTKTIKGEDVHLSSPVKEEVLDRQDVLKICDDLLQYDIVDKPCVKSESDHKLDVLAAGLEEVCVKQVAKREVRDENVGDQLIVQSEISIQQNLSPSKAELVTVTPGSTPTSPKLATEEPTDFPIHKDDKIPKEPTMDEIASAIDSQIVDVTSTVIDKISLERDEKVVESKVELQSVSLKSEVQSELFESVDVPTTEKYLDEAKEKVISETTKERDEKISETVQESQDKTVTRMVVTASSEDGGHEIEICESGTITFTKSPSPEDSLKETRDRSTPEKDSLRSVSSTPERDSIASEKLDTEGQKVTFDDSLEKLSKLETDTTESAVSIDQKVLVETSSVSAIESSEAAKTPESLRSEDASPAESMFAKSPTDKISPAYEFEATTDHLHQKSIKSKSPSEERNLDQKNIASVVPETTEISTDRKSPSIEKDSSRKESLSQKVDISIQESSQLMSNLEKESTLEENLTGQEIQSQDKQTDTTSKSSSAERELSHKEESKSPSAEKDDLDRSKSPSVEKDKSDRSKSPSAEKDDLDRSKSPSVEKDKSDRSKSPSAEKDDLDRSKSPSVEKDKSDRSKSPSAEKDDLDKSKSPSVEKDKSDRSKSPSAEKDNLDRSKSSSEEKEGLDRSKSPSVEKDKLDRSKSPSVEKDVTDRTKSPSAEKDHLDRSKSPSVEKDQLDRSKSPSVEKDKLDRSKSPSAEKDDIDRSKSPSVDKDKSDRSKSPSAEKEISSKETSLQKLITADDIDISSVTESEDKKVDRSKSPGIEKESASRTSISSVLAESSNIVVSKHSQFPQTSDLEKQLAHEGFAEQFSSSIDEKGTSLDKSRSPSAEKESTQKETTPDPPQSKSPSAEKEISRKESASGETIFLKNDKDGGSKVSSPEKSPFTSKTDKSKSPSVEREVDRKEPSPESMHTGKESLTEKLAQDAISIEVAKADETKSPSTEKESISKEASTEKSIEKESSPIKSVSKEATPEKSIEKEASPAKSISKEASPEKSIAKEASPEKTLSKDPSPEKSIEKEASPTKTISKEASPEKLIETEASSEKSISKEATPEKSIEKEASPTKSVSKEASPEKSIEKEASPEKSISKEATPEKSIEKEASPAKSISKEASPEKSIDQEASPAKSVSKEASPEKSIDQEASPTKSVSKEASPEKSIEKEASPEKSISKEATPEKSIEKEASPAKSVSKEASPEKSIDQEASPAKSVSKEASPEKSKEKEASPEKSISKEATPEKSIDKEASPAKSVSKEASPTKSVSKEGSPDKLIGKEASPEKSIEKESSPAKSISSIDENLLVSVAQSEDKLDRSKSPSVAKESSQQEGTSSKSKSPSIEREVSFDKRTSSISMVSQVTEIANFQTQEKSKSPSVEKEITKTESSLLTSIQHEHDDASKSKSPSPQKELSTKESSPAKSDTSDVDRSKSPSVEKDFTKHSEKEPSPAKSTSSVIDQEQSVQSQHESSPAKSIDDRQTYERKDSISEAERVRRESHSEDAPAKSLDDRQAHERKQSISEAQRVRRESHSEDAPAKSLDDRQAHERKQSISEAERVRRESHSEDAPAKSLDDRQAHERKQSISEAERVRRESHSEDAPAKSLDDRQAHERKTSRSEAERMRRESHSEDAPAKNIDDQQAYERKFSISEAERVRRESHSEDAPAKNFDDRQAYERKVSISEAERMRRESHSEDAPAKNYEDRQAYERKFSISEAERVRRESHSEDAPAKNLDDRQAYERKVSISSSVESQYGDRQTDRSRSQSLYETGEKSPFVLSRTASSIEERHADEFGAVGYSFDESQKESDENEEIIANYIFDEYISKNKKISLKELEELARAQSIPRQYIILIIENVITRRKLSRQSILADDFPSSQGAQLPPLADIWFDSSDNHHHQQQESSRKVSSSATDKELKAFIESETLGSSMGSSPEPDQYKFSSSDRPEPHIDEEIIISEEKRTDVESLIFEEYIRHSQKLTDLILEEIVRRTSVPRYIILEIIEEIVVKKSLNREAIADSKIFQDVDDDDNSQQQQQQAKQQKSGQSSPDLLEEQYEDSVDKSIPYTDYESPFHKAFVGGMTEIRTTHITTTLSGGKSTTPPDSDEKSSGSITGARRKSSTISEKLLADVSEEATSQQQQQQIGSTFGATSLEDITIVTTTTVKTIISESTAQPITAPSSGSGGADQQLISLESHSTAAGVPSSSFTSSSSTFCQETRTILESVMDHGLAEQPLIRDLINDDKSTYSGKSSPDVSLPKDIVYGSGGGSTGKSTPDITMSPLIQAHFSGRSTPASASTTGDKQQHPLSRTATPEGFRSGEVIRTIVTTTRTMSDDGDIITTTQEVTEATNERGETVVIAQKTDVKVDERAGSAAGGGPVAEIKSLESSQHARTLSEGSDLFEREAGGALPPVSPRSDLSTAGNSRAVTHVWGSSEERHTFSDDDPTGSPMFSSSPLRTTTTVTAASGDSGLNKQLDDFTTSGLMSSSFYGELPDEIATAVSTEFMVEKEPVTMSGSSSSKRYIDEADLDFEKALSSVSTKDEAAAAQSSSKDDESKDKKRDPLADWGSPLGLPSPRPPRKFNLKSSPVQPCSSADLSPDSLNFDVINDWGEPMRLPPTPAPSAQATGGSEASSNKPSPATPKKEPPRQPKRVLAENIKNKRSESPGKYDKRSKDSRNKIQPVYVDLTYVSHHGNSFYTALDFFKKVRARYYVFSGTEPSREVYDALLEAKKTWEDKDLGNDDPDLRHGHARLLGGRQRGGPRGPPHRPVALRLQMHHQSAGSRDELQRLPSGVLGGTAVRRRRRRLRGYHDTVPNINTGI